jgi:hypothetical protein
VRLNRRRKLLVRQAKDHFRLAAEKSTGHSWNSLFVCAQRKRGTKSEYIITDSYNIGFSIQSGPRTEHCACGCCCMNVSLQRGRATRKKGLPCRTRLTGCFVLFRERIQAAAREFMLTPFFSIRSEHRATFALRWRLTQRWLSPFPRLPRRKVWPSYSTVPFLVSPHDDH